MAVNQVCFVHILANLTQKALIWLPTHTVKVSVIFFTNQKSTSKMWFKSHAFRDSQQKNPMKKKCIVRDKERKVWQLLLVDRQQLWRKTVPPEQMDYLQWHPWSDTHLKKKQKKPPKLLKSSHIRTSAAWWGDLSTAK